MLSKQLYEFFTSYMDADLDPDDAHKIIHAHPETYAWIKEELPAAHAAGLLTPAKMTEMTSIVFKDQAAVDSKLRAWWQEWFSELPVPF